MLSKEIIVYKAVFYTKPAVTIWAPPGACCAKRAEVPCPITSPQPHQALRVSPQGRACRNPCGPCANRVIPSLETRRQWRERNGSWIPAKNQWELRSQHGHPSSNVLCTTQSWGTALQGQSRTIGLLYTNYRFISFLCYKRLLSLLYNSIHVGIPLHLAADPLWNPVIHMVYGRGLACNIGILEVLSNLNVSVVLYEIKVSQADPVSSLPKHNVKKKAYLIISIFIKSHFTSISNILWDCSGTALPVLQHLSWYLAMYCIL